MKFGVVPDIWRKYVCNEWESNRDIVENNEGITCLFWLGYDLSVHIIYSYNVLLHEHRSCRMSPVWYIRWPSSSSSTDGARELCSRWRFKMEHGPCRWSHHEVVVVVVHTRAARTCHRYPQCPSHNDVADDPPTAPPIHHRANTMEMWPNNQDRRGRANGLPNQQLISQCSKYSGTYNIRMYHHNKATDEGIHVKGYFITGYVFLNGYIINRFITRYIVYFTISLFCSMDRFNISYAIINHQKVHKILQNNIKQKLLIYTPNITKIDLETISVCQDKIYFYFQK